MYTGIATKAAVSQMPVFQIDAAQTWLQHTSKKKDTNKENEPDPADEDELEELPLLRKRARRQVADGASLQTTSKLTLRTCSQKQVPLRIRKTHTIQPLNRLRLRGMTYLMLGIGFRVCLAIW